MKSKPARKYKQRKKTATPAPIPEGEGENAGSDGAGDSGIPESEGPREEDEFRYPPPRTRRRVVVPSCSKAIGP